MHSGGDRRFEVWWPSPEQKLFRQENNCRQSSDLAGMMKSCHQWRRDHMVHLEPQRGEFIFLNYNKHLIKWLSYARTLFKLFHI